MKQWHLEHVEKTIKKFVVGLSETASIWEKRQHKKYVTIANCCRQINYDLKHGVIMQEASLIMEIITSDVIFASFMHSSHSLQRF